MIADRRMFSRRGRSGRGRRVGLWTVTAAVLGFMYLPIVVVFANAFNADKELAEWGGFTLRWFDEAWSDATIRSAFVQSVVIATTAAVLAVLIGLTAGLWGRGGSRRGLRLLDAATYARLILPEVVIALALFALFSRLKVHLGMATVVIGHVVFISAFTTLIIQARVSGMSASLEEAAADLGATQWRIFRRVTLRLLSPAIIVAALLAFTLSFDNVVTATFLSGGEVETLPMLILGLVRFSVTPEVNAIGAGVMAVTIVGFGLAVGLAGPARERYIGTGRGGD